MAEPTDQHRSHAGGFENIPPHWQVLIGTIAQALADAFTAGQHEAKAEDAGVAHSAFDNAGIRAKQSSGNADWMAGYEKASIDIADAILASSSAPTVRTQQGERR